MGKNELVKRNIHEVAQCDTDPRLREDFVVNESEAGLLGVGAPMPYPDGKKPTALDRAIAKVSEQLDPRLAEYRRKVASGEYNPKDHIEAMTAQEARPLLTDEVQPPVPAPDVARLPDVLPGEEE